MSLDALFAETVNIQGHGGELIPAYLARPLHDRRMPGVLVIHHKPSYDRPSNEIARTFAVHGYTALLPNLHHRDAPGAEPDELRLRCARPERVPDDRALGDLAGGRAHPRSLATASGRVGVIGYCSGGRHAYLAACTMKFEASVDCHGGGVAVPAENRTERQPMSPVERTENLGWPLLGLLGEEDPNPDPEQVRHIEEALRRHKKEFSFHVYPGAGHAFFSVNRPNYRADAATDGWEKILDFFDKYPREG